MAELEMQLYKSSTEAYLITYGAAIGSEFILSTLFLSVFGFTD